jgi:hypothetical protein
MTHSERIAIPTANLTTYAGEHRLLTVGKECLVSAFRPDTAKQVSMLVAVDRTGFFTDYPILYDNDTVAWDRPERFSKRFIKLAQTLILETAKEIAFKR